MKWAGPSRLLCGLGLGLALLNMNWAGLGLTLLILSKTIWNGLDPQGSYVDWAWAWP